MLLPQFYDIINIIIVIIVAAHRPEVEKMNDKWLEFAIRIQSIAQAGLQYGKDKYDRERYEELRKISAEMMSEKTDIPVNKFMIFSAAKQVIKRRKLIPEPLFLLTAKYCLCMRITAHGRCRAAGVIPINPLPQIPKRSFLRKPDLMSAPKESLPSTTGANTM